MFNAGHLHPLIHWRRDVLHNDVILNAPPRLLSDRRAMGNDTGLLARRLNQRGVVCNKEQGAIIIGDNLPNTEWNKVSIDDCISICKDLLNCYATHFDHSEQKCNFLKNETNRLYYGGHTSAVCEVPRRAPRDPVPTTMRSPLTSTTPLPSNNPGGTSTYMGGVINNPGGGSQQQKPVDIFGDNPVSYGDGRGGNASGPGHNNHDGSRGHRGRPFGSNSSSPGGGRVGVSSGTGYTPWYNHNGGGYNNNDDFMSVDPYDPVDEYWNVQPFYNNMGLYNDFPYGYMFGDGIGGVGGAELYSGGVGAYQPYGEFQYNYGGGRGALPSYGVDQSLDRLSYGDGGNDSVWTPSGDNNNSEGPFEDIWRGAALHESGDGGAGAHRHNNDHRNHSHLY